LQILILRVRSLKNASRTGKPIELSTETPIEEAVPPGRTA